MEANPRAHEPLLFAIEVISRHDHLDAIQERDEHALAIASRRARSMAVQRMLPLQRRFHDRLSPRDLAGVALNAE